MAFRIKISSRVFMDPQVELGFALNNSFIKTGQQNMIFIVDPGLWRHQESVVFPCIAMNDG